MSWKRGLGMGWLLRFRWVERRRGRGAWRAEVWSFRETCVMR